VTQAATSTSTESPQDMTASMPQSGHPDATLSTKEAFGVSFDWDMPAFSERTAMVPDIDPDYQFDEDTTKAICAGFMHNVRVLIQGFHGTGKSTHIEQIAARLNWPCLRINLDSHISRVDLLGKDTISLKDGKQVTSFKEGLLPFALQNPVALVFDEYDAGRPDVMFVIQRILETEGQLTLLEQNKTIRPNPFFRLFATANTIGLGDATGLYHGTQAINQGQMDRWTLTARLDYLPFEQELDILKAKSKTLKANMVSGDKKQKRDDWLNEYMLGQMITMADLTRKGFQAGDISTLMSPRTVLNWAMNTLIFQDLHEAFLVSFMNKCDETERPIIAEYYQRCFDIDLGSFNEQEG
jgi:cobaltochelatase CobS